MTRNPTIDILRALCIIFVVLGHCGFPWTTMLYSFHVPLFFVISGMTEKPFHVNDDISVKSHLLKKAKRLYVPFVIFSILELLLHNTLIDLHIYASEATAPNAFNNLFLVSRYSYIEMGQRFLKAFIFAGGSQLGGTLWFFKVLFFCALIFKLECILYKKFSKRLLIQSLTNLVLYAVGWGLTKQGVVFPLGLETVLLVLIFYNFGFCIHNYHTRVEQTISSHKFTFSVIALGLLFLLYRYQEVNIGNNVITNPFLLLITATLGFVFCYALSDILAKTKIKNIMSFVGTNTVCVVLLHFLAFKLVNYFLILYKGYDLLYLAAFPVLEEGLWPVYALVGITVPLLANFGYEKIRSKRTFTR